MMVLLLVGMAVATSSTGMFNCFGDQCTRGVQYCMADMERCGFCSHEQNKCGTSDMPRDCDGYCMGKEADALRVSLNASVTENQALLKELDKLRAQLRQARQSNTSQKTQQLQISLKQLNTSLNSCTAERGHLLEQANTTSRDLKGCQRKQERWFISNLVLGGIIGFISIAIIYLLLVRRKQQTNESRDEDITHENKSYQRIPPPDDTGERSKDKGLADSGVSLEDIPDELTVTQDGEQESGTFKEDEDLDIGQNRRKQSQEERIFIGPNNVPPCSPSGPFEAVFK